MHEKRARFNDHEVRSRDAIIVRDRQSPRHGADGKNYGGDRNRAWVRRAESKYPERSENLNAAHSLKLGERQSAGDVISNPKKSGVGEVGSRSVQGKVGDTEITSASSSTVTSKKFESAGGKNTEASDIDGAHLQQTGSDDGHTLKLGEVKVAHGGSDVHQRQGFN
jgi:hypothetical protein